MPDTRIRTPSPPRQLVPPDHVLFHRWRADGVDFELWAYEEAGFILATPRGSFEVAGRVDICGDQLTVVWQGAVTDKPQPWLNAQRAIAHAKYAEQR